MTGAGSGIGLASATRFAEEGMKVVLADIQEDALVTAVARLQEAGHDVIGVRTDVSQHEQLQRLADQTIASYGKVSGVTTSVLINLASNEYFKSIKPGSFPYEIIVELSSEYR